ncbi:MAG: response regulator [Gemmatimonadaceae bacterium]
MTSAPEVLLADDDVGAREFLARALRDLGYAVTVVSDGADAWGAYQREHVPLVILDINVSRLGGLEVCRRIRAADPARETFVLMCTGHDAHESLAAVLDAGADDYLAKPVTAEQLRARLALAERRLAEEASRRQAEAELARARWLAGIGEMTIALQHEINNPLSALISHAELALLDAADRGERNEQVETILQQAQRIAEIVRRIGALRNPMSVEYLPGTSMIDLGAASGDERELTPPTRKRMQ